MTIPIIVPDLGATGSDVLLSQWFVTEGEFVHEGDPLFSVETDKAVSNVEAYCDGFLKKIVVRAGETADIGATVAILEEDFAAAETPAAATVDVRAGRDGRQEPAASANASPKSRDGRLLISPRARRAASELGIIPSDVSGSGLKGEIHERDVISFASRVTGSSSPSKTYSGSADASLRPAGASQAGMFCGVLEVDLSDALDLLLKLSESSNESTEATLAIRSFLLSAAARALAKFPELNVRISGETVVPLDRRQFAIGLVSSKNLEHAVVEDLEQLSLGELIVKTGALRSGSNALEEPHGIGGSLAVYFPELFQLDWFLPAIPQGYPAVVGFGRIASRAVVRDGGITIRSIMPVTLAVDARVDRGVAGGAFLYEIKELLEKPYSLLMGSRN
jgi:pyruvate dehydrogenase E2 component (dihydrolipoamide acetyltransferase)